MSPHETGFGKDQGESLEPRLSYVVLRSVESNLEDGVQKGKVGPMLPVRQTLYST